MKINQLVEFVGSSKNKMLKPEQLQQVVAKEIEVKDYIGIKEKKALIDDIIKSCIFYDDGIFKFDDIDKYIVFTMKTISAYTNLELSNDIEEDYDILCNSKLLDVVINTFKKEYDDVNVLLQMKCEYILSGNNIDAQVGRFLSSLLEKLDVFAAGLSNKLENFDINNLPIGIEDINKLMEFVNSQKK